MANKRTCTICGTQYEYCGNCAKYNREETWRYVYCSENCRNIYHVYDEYRQNHISADEAIERFKAYDMPTIDKYHPVIRQVIEKIYAEATPAIEKTLTSEEVEETPVAEEAPAVEEEPTVEETPVVETPIRLGRRKRSTVTE